MSIPFVFLLFSLLALAALSITLLSDQSGEKPLLKQLSINYSWLVFVAALGLVANEYKSTIKDTMVASWNVLKWNAVGENYVMNDLNIGVVCYMESPREFGGCLPHSKVILSALPEHTVEVDFLAASSNAHLRTDRHHAVVDERNVYLEVSIFQREVLLNVEQQKLLKQDKEHISRIAKSVHGSDNPYNFPLRFKVALTKLSETSQENVHQHMQAERKRLAELERKRVEHRMAKHLAARKNLESLMDSKNHNYGSSVSVHTTNISAIGSGSSLVSE